MNYFFFSSSHPEKDENWRWGYTWNNKTYDYRCGIEIYEESYFRFLKNKEKKMMDWLTESGSECYDTNVSNINAFCDYNFQGE